MEHKLIRYIYLAIVLIVASVFVAALSASIEILERYTYQLHKVTEYDIVETCEVLSSQATNENWSYADCKNNLREATGTQDVKLL